MSDMLTWALFDLLFPFIELAFYGYLSYTNPVMAIAVMMMRQIFVDSFFYE